MMPPVVSGGMTAGASTWDGRFLVVAQGSALTAFDTGSGKNVAGSLTLGFQPSRLFVAPRDQAIVALDPGSGADGSLAIISDVAGFVGSPGGATPKIVRMPGASRAHRDLLARRHQALRAHRRRDDRSLRAGRDADGQRHPDLRPRRHHDRHVRAARIRRRSLGRSGDRHAGRRRRRRQADRHRRSDAAARSPRCSATSPARARCAWSTAPPSSSPAITT